MIEQTDNRREVVYKKIKKEIAHCNVCDDELMGNNSVAMPYECSCGTWEFWFGDDPLDYHFYIKKV